MHKVINDLDNERTELTKNYDADVSILKNGLLLLENDEIPHAVRDAIFNDIEVSFQKKWTLYKEAMKKLDDKMGELNQYY